MLGEFGRIETSISSKTLPSQPLKSLKVPLVGHNNLNQVIIFKASSPNLCHHSHIEGKWVHLFSDGAVERVTEKVVVGGVLQDKDGNWILGYNRFLDNCTPFEVELWGIIDGLLILLREGYKRVTI